MAEHRVSVLSASLRRYEDPARSSDPRIRAIVAELRAVQVAPPLRAHFRADLRSQLVAVAPRLVAEGVGAERPLTHIAKPASAAAPRELPVAGVGTRGGLARVGALSLGRPVAISAAALAVISMVLGALVWLSTNAVPGDTLYGMKRANEDVQLAFTSGDTARAKKYLEFAGHRADEVSTLLSRATALAGSGSTAGAGISSRTADLVSSTLDSADSDVRSASRLLGDAAVQSNSPAPLDVIAQWAPSQVQRLQSIANRLPSSSSLHSRTEQSSQLIRAAVTRSQSLTSMLDCNCLNKAPTDSLGPLPCIVCGTGSSTPSVGVVPSITVPNPGSSTGATSPGATGTSSDGQSPTGTGSPAQNPLPLPSFSNLPPIQLPSILPIPKPSGDPSATCVINLIGICVKI